MTATLDLYDTTCPECHAPVTPPVVRCCCERCGHGLAGHGGSGSLCEACGQRCGLECLTMLRRQAAGLATEGEQ